MKRTYWLIIMILAVMHAQQAPGEVPQLINYQGRLVNGTNLVNGTAQDQRNNISI